MTLFDGEQGKTYVILGMFIEDAVTRRLEALGLNDGTAVHILNRKKKGSMIIRVRGTRLALGRQISSQIEVSQIEVSQIEVSRTEASQTGAAKTERKEEELADE